MARVFITVNFQISDKFLRDQSLNSFFITVIFSVKFCLYISFLYSSYLIPRSLKMPFLLQSRGFSVLISSTQPLFAPIQTAWVFSKLTFRPDISENALMRLSAELSDTSLSSKSSVVSSAYCIIRNSDSSMFIPFMLGSNLKAQARSSTTRMKI